MKQEGRKFCFIDDIADPSKPDKNCFKDVKFSKTNGRFYSYDACKDEHEEKESSTTASKSATKGNMEKRKESLSPMRKFYKHLGTLFERK